jgi:type I protein arginine methyltransferase
MYSLGGYGSLLLDEGRITAYTEALRRAVRPGAVVLDIGTGPGVFALLACRLGARRVYAVEPAPVIQVAREIAAANGYAGRVEFIQDLSTRLELPEPADVVVSDLHGVLPLFQHHLPTIRDARERLLVPGGVLIPQRDTLWAAVVEAEEEYARHVSPWNGELLGLDLRAGLPLAVNTWRKARFRADQCLTEPLRWATLDYTSIESPDARAELTFTVERAGTGHGLAVWFDSVLAEGVEFSNAPGEPELIYGCAFLPWQEPVSLAAGETVRAELRADLTGEDYLWRWDTWVPAEGTSRAAFRQSSFFGAPLTPESLGKRAAGHLPRLSEEGEMDRLVLERMAAGTASLARIAEELAARFPHRFRGADAALPYVSRLSERYSR